MKIVALRTGTLSVGDYNARRDVGDITDLKASIELEGLLQPVVVRPVKGKYEVVVGSRRLAAAKAAGLKTVLALVREMNDGEALLVSLSENIQRQSLDPEEEAEALQTLMRIDDEKYGNTKKLAKALGISETRIKQKLMVMELMPRLRREVPVRYAPPVYERRESKALPFEHATIVADVFRTEEVRKLPDKIKEKKQVELAKTIAPLPQEQARKVADRFKMFPQKPIAAVKREALQMETGVMIRSYFRPRIARELERAARDRNMTTEELVPLAVEDWLRSKRYLD